MKKGTNIFIVIISILGGALISYYLCQYKYFNIDTEINVSETILAVITAIIGLYIAISLQSRFNRNQNIYNYLINKFDACWNLFNNLSSTLIAENQIELSNLTRATKETTKYIDHLKRMFYAFGKDEKCINDLDLKLDALEQILTSGSIITNNRLDYTIHKSAIKSLIDDINALFVVCFNQINIL